MNIETIELSKLYKIEGTATLKCFVHDTDEEMKRYNNDLPAMIVCPGGGYGFTSRREADPIAVEFYNRKYAAFVLNYDVAPYRYPVALTELAAAVDYVRKNAEKFRVNPDRIFVVGFSAGGHLVGNLANFWNNLPVPEANGKNSTRNPTPSYCRIPSLCLIRTRARSLTSWVQRICPIRALRRCRSTKPLPTSTRRALSGLLRKISA